MRQSANAVSGRRTDSRHNNDGEGYQERGVSMRLVLLIIGLLMACGPALAATTVQPGRVRVPSIFNNGNGLPQSGVNAVVQTGDGYLWVGTFGGLVRFDGQAFTVFRNLPANGGPDSGHGHQESPPSDRVTAGSTRWRR